MGAGQSSDKAPQQNAVETKTSYYELLGVEKQASQDDIKKAYRRKALELHPDRNYGKEDDATKLFAEIQAAYEVLSDPQERAWYDSHESAILRGNTGEESEHYEHDVRITTADDISGMMRKFNRNIEFSDAPTGFFGFVRETFETLAKEEQLAADWEGVDVPDYPSFGHRDDTYEDVVKEFYAMWNGFSTRKSYAWMDKWRLSEAPDRFIRRQMEKENKKIRDDAKRDFNEAVRALILFIRKRDPRYAPTTQTDAERAKSMKDAAAAQAARQRAINAAQLKQEMPAWTTTREPEEVEDSEEEEVVEEEFECVACKKTFKSEQQVVAHERSKKHQKAVAGLKRKMFKENKNLHLDEDIPSSAVVTPASDDGSYTLHEEDVNKTEENIADLNIDNGGEKTITHNGDSDAPSPDNEHAGDHLDVKADPVTDSEEDDDADDAEGGDGDYSSRSKVEAYMATSTAGVESTTETPVELTGPKLGKAAQKRAKKAAKAAVADQEEAKFKCVTCNNGFPSKTRLFQHISDFGHAAPVSNAKVGKGKKKR
ncbi:DnaJ-domain-containing protein [Patellaria atrata CBS 101060]|uniref:DnaJ-domain-containing protein n=1 Tax=Patellaria atrata CBS 101060 TaxID=1346257 RepID=A0A9P4S4D1_9PEZI|nr:DnaJ-domain-containing protein [Patellaria atrata CBS 101060]